MLPQNNPDRIRIVFDDHRLVANAGLLLPATLAQHLGLRELVDSHVDLGDAPGRANLGDKMLTLVASALAGGDCIDDADVLRTGGTTGAIGCAVKAPSTLGTFLRSFRWGHVRQLDRVSRQLLARAWQAGAGPGDALLTAGRMDGGSHQEKETPSAETFPPGNHIPPGSPGDPDSLLRHNTCPGRSPNSDPGTVQGRSTGVHCPGFHPGPDGETYRRAQGDAGQSSDSRTNSNSGAPGGTRSPPGTGLLCVALRTI